MRISKAGDHMAIPSFRVSVLFLNECDPAEAAGESSDKIFVVQIAFQSHPLFAIAVEQQHRWCPHRTKPVEPCRVLFNVCFDRQEVLVDEVRGLLICVRLGVQPSTRSSSWSRAEIH